MLIGKAVNTLQFQKKNIFDQDVGIIFSDALSLIVDCELRLGYSADPANRELLKERFLVHLLEESRAKNIRDLKDSIDYALRKRIGTSMFIGVHRRPMNKCARRSESSQVL